MPLNTDEAQGNMPFTLGIGATIQVNDLPVELKKEAVPFNTTVVGTSASPDVIKAEYKRFMGHMNELD